MRLYCAIPKLWIKHPAAPPHPSSAQTLGQLSLAKNYGEENVVSLHHLFIAALIQYIYLYISIGESNGHSVFIFQYLVNPKCLYSTKLKAENQ